MCKCPEFGAGSIIAKPYSGEFCDDVDNPCDNNATLVVKNGKTECECLPLFEGSLCETDVEMDACTTVDASQPRCENGGVCTDVEGGFLGTPEAGPDFICECDPELDFNGATCESLIDNCVNHACQNGGTCLDGVRSYSCLWGSCSKQVRSQHAR